MDEFPPPDAPRPPTDRHRHPYHMHDMMRRAPVAARTTLSALESAPIPDPPSRGRVLFTGIGTSFHAALAVARAANAEATLPLRHAVAVPAFELRTDPPGLEDISQAVVFSASGETDVTRRAVRRLRERQVPVFLVTASERAPMAPDVDLAFTTRYSDEASYAHTVSYTSAIVAGLGLLARWSGEAGRWAELEVLPEAITSALAVENSLVDAAERLTDYPHWLLAGSGFRGPTVREASLKFREAAGRFAAPVGIEEMLHGPLAAVDQRTVVIALTGTALEAERARQGLEAVRAIGAETIHFDSTPGATGPSAWTTQPLRGPLSPVVDIAPFQVLAYWMSVNSGRNPDTIGYDDPRHRDARSRYGL